MVRQVICFRFIEGTFLPLISRCHKILFACNTAVMVVYNRKVFSYYAYKKFEKTSFIPEDSQFLCHTQRSQA